MKKLLFYSILFILFSSCARTYRLVNPVIYYYEFKHQLTDDIRISYSYNIHAYFKNKPYARKERNYGKKLVAIKIENQSDSALTLTNENLVINTSSGKEVKLIDFINYSQSIRQFPEAFILFYGLAGFGVRVEEVNGQKSTYLTYTPIPVLLGIANAIFAGTSNKKHHQNLYEHQILGKTIEVNSTQYGLIAIEEENTPKLEFSFK